MDCAVFCVLPHASNGPERTISYVRRAANSSHLLFISWQRALSIRHDNDAHTHTNTTSAQRSWTTAIDIDSAKVGGGKTEEAKHSSNGGRGHSFSHCSVSRYALLALHSESRYFHRFADMHFCCRSLLLQHPYSV